MGREEGWEEVPSLWEGGEWEGEGRGLDRWEEVTHWSPSPTEGWSGEDVLSMRG